MQTRYIRTFALLSILIITACSQNATDEGPSTTATSDAPIAAGAIGVLPLGVTLQADNSALLEWVKDNSQTTYYDLQVEADNGYSNQHRITANQASFLDSNLMVNVTYSYTLQAYDQSNTLISTYQASARINVYATVSSDSVL